MSFKTILVAAPLALGAMYFLGSVDRGWSREVGRPPAEVTAGLDDLRLPGQAGAPGADRSHPGGTAAGFRTERANGAMRWIVMGGSEVAMTMTARLEPLDGGKRTRVVAGVERGDAPADLVPPAFRSEPTAMRLFAAALDRELDELTGVDDEPAMATHLKPDDSADDGFRRVRSEMKVPDHPPAE